MPTGCIGPITFYVIREDGGSVNDRTIAGLALFFLPVTFITALMWGEAVAPDYSIHDNAISDLGVIPETSLLFTLTLLAVGVLAIVGGYFLHREEGRKGMMALFFLAGIGAVGAGLIDLNDPSGLHSIFALMAFLSFNVIPIAVGRRLGGPMRYISFAAGALGLIYVMVMFLGDVGITDLFGPIGHGGTERMIVYPPILWFIAYSGMLLDGGGLGGSSDAPGKRQG